MCVSALSADPLPRSRTLARAGLLGSTALVAVSLATGAMAQTTPTGGAVVDNTGSGGGYQLTNSTLLTVNNVTINNTTGSPTAHAIDWNSTIFAGFGRRLTLDGTSSISSTAGSAINFQSTGSENMGFVVLGDQTLTGLSGVVINNTGAIFHRGAGSLNLVARTAGQGVGLDFNSSGSCICDTSFTGPVSITNFATGADLTAAAYVNFATGSGGAITGAFTGINAAAVGGVTLSIGSDISATNNGIVADSDGTIAIAVSGDIVSSSGAGIFADSALASGNTIDVSGSVTGLFGINLTAGGYTATIADGATVTGTGSNNRAIIGQANSTVLNNGSLLTTASGTGFSVGVQFATSGAIVNTGVIDAATSGGYGAYANQALTLTNSGTVSAGDVGVYAGTGSTITNLDGGVISGGSQAIAIVGAATIDLQAGSTTGAISAASTGAAQVVTVAGALTGAYTGASGVDTLTLAATGSMTSANLGGGNDMFTWQGGTLGGLIDGGFGTDSFISNLGTGSASLSLNNLTGFESYTHQAGDLTLTGNRTGGAGWSLVPGTSLVLDGSLSVTNTAITMNGNGDAATVSILAGSTLNGHTGVYYNTGFPHHFSNAGSITATSMGVFSNGPLSATNTGSVTATTGSAFSFGFATSTVTNSGALTGGSDADTGFGVWSYNGATVNNTGTITGGSGGISSGRIIGATAYGGLLTVTNGATGDITGDVGIITGGSSSLNLNNSGLIEGTSGGGVVANGTGTVSITNNAGGEITGTSHGVTLLSGSVVNSGTITTTGGAIGDVGYGVYASSLTGNAVVTNNAGGGIVGRWAGIRLVGAGSITNSGLIQGNRFAGAELQTTTQVTNNDGGVIYGASGEGHGLLINGGDATITNNAGGLIVGQGAAGILDRGTGTATITNAGTIGVGSVDGAGVYTFGGTGFAIDLANGGTVNNSGTIHGGGSAIHSVAGLVNLTNGAAGLIEGGLGFSGGVFQDAVVAAGGTILNAGAITTDTRAGTLSEPTYSAIYWGAAGGTITNAATGSLTGGTENLFGTAIQARGVTTFNNYGSATGGASAGSGFRQFNNQVSTINLHAGSVTGSILTGAADDVLSIYSGRGTDGVATIDGASGITLQEAGTLGGAVFGAVDLGGGSNTLGLRGAGDGTAANGAVGDLDLSDVAGVSVLSKLDSGTWMLTGDGSGVSTINAGDGGGNDGMLIFDGTSGLTGDIFVNGAVIRAETAGAFGAGAIHLINPTISYGATGTYANDILLEVAAPATGDPSTLQTDAGVTATLSGAITTGAGVDVDPVQPLVIDGLGTIVLTNSANSWAGDTTINAGATLQGAANTISGGGIVNNGDLVFNQTADGTSSLTISGTGDLTLTGGAVLTLSGANSYSGATWINDGALAAAGGSAIGDSSAVTVASGATLQLVDDETIGSLAGDGDVFVGVNTLSVGADGTSTVFSGVISDNDPLTFVGSWRVSDGPVFWDGPPPIYSGVQAAALLFGGDAGDYQISTVSDQIADINNSAWMDGFGMPWAMFAEDYFLDSGAPGYTGGDYSAYVRDHVDPTRVNYAFATGDSLGGGLTKIGGGTLTLTGANTYTGLTLVTGGVLELVNGAAIADVGTVEVSAGGTLAVTTSETIANLTGAGASTLGSGATLTLGAASGQYDGDVSGLGTLSVAGGSLALGGALTNAGGLQFLNGTSGSITSTGSVTTPGGVAVRMYGDGGSLTNAGTISGLFAVSAAGDLDLTNSGSISASVTNFNNSGIYAAGDGVVVNSGSITSGTNAIYTQGVGSVTNSGLIQGGGAASTIRLFGADSSVINLADGQITTTGTGAGLYLDGANASVVNAGTISGGNAVALVSGGTVINSGILTSTAGSGVLLQAAGSVDNQASGSILGATNGVTYTAGSATIANAGEITGANGAGLRLLGGGGVTNAATGEITGTGNALFVQGGALNLVSYGSLVGTSGVAIVTTGVFDNTIDLQAGSSTSGSVITDAGADTLTVAGALTGDVSLGGGADSFTLLGGGSVTGLIDGGTGTDAFVSDLGVGSASLSLSNLSNFESYAHQSGSLTLTGARTGGVGWSIWGGDLTLDGTLFVDNGHGLIAMDAATINIADGATLTGNQNGVQGDLGVSITLNNSGVITSNNVLGGGGVRLNAASTINNIGGIIDGGLFHGVSLSGAGQVINNDAASTIRGARAIETYDAGAAILNAGLIEGLGDIGVVFHSTNGVLTNLSTGEITGVNQGAYSTTGLVTVVNSGSIAGGQHGLVAVARADVTNSATGVMRGDIYNAVYSGGADTTVTNAGLMEGGNAAVYLDGANTVIDNSGVIRVIGGSAPTVISGVYVSGAGASVTNSGTIESTLTDGRGIFLAGGGGSIDNQSGGVISGNGDGAAILLVGAGYTLNLAAGSTVNGLIDASTTTGLNLVDIAGELNGAYVGGSGVDDVTLISGGVFGGAILGGAGIDALTLTGAGDSALDMGLIAEFESRTMNGTGVWTLSGADAQDLTWTINSGVLSASGGAAIHNGASVVVNAAGELNLAGDEAIDSLTGNGAVTLGTNTLMVGAADGSSQFDGIISGTGGLAQVGAGTLTLTGANTYTGWTSVAAGTLQLGAADVLADASSLSVADGAAFDLQAFDETVDVAAINGALIGTGTLTASQYQLTGATIDAALGAGTLFNLGGTSTLNGTVAAQLISLAGGTLVLGGDERLADTATLSVDDGATFDLAGFDEEIGSLWGEGDIDLGGGSLTFGGVDSGFGGTLSGLGAVNHTAGLFTLLGDHSVSSINNSGGELRFLGSTAGDVTISAGVLTGQADIGGDLVVGSDGVLSPGLAGVNNGIGAFFAGGLTMNGGTLTIDLLGASGGYLVDQVLVSGTANLTGGTLATNFIGAITDFNFTTTYVVVAADTLIGRFDNGGEFTADPTKDGLYWRVRYDLVADAAVIELRQMVDFQIGEKGTLNQNAVGGALNGGQVEAGDDWARILAQLAPLEDEALNSALNSISGEGLANASTSALGAGDRFMEAIRQGAGANANGGDDTLAFGSQLMLSSDGFSGRLAGQDNINLNAVPAAGSGDRARGFWVSAYAGESDLEGRAGQSDVTTDLTGLAGGFNVAVGDLTLGSAIGVSDLESHVDARASEYEMSLTHTAVYGRYDDGVWFGDLTLMGYSGEMDASRTVTVGAGVAQTAGSTTLAGHSISAAFGRRFEVAPATQLSVGGVASVSSVDIDAYTETGAGGLSLEVASQRREWQTLTVDARLARDYNLGGGQMRAYVGLGAMGTQGDLRALADMRFSGAAAGFGGFVVEGAETPPVAGIVDFGAQYEADAGWTAGIGYRGVFADRLTDHRIGARVAISW